MRTRKRKFKKGLVRQVKADEQEQLQQNKLKEKYDLDSPDIVVVEKNNTVKFLVKVCIQGIKVFAAIIIFLLSAVGLLAILYPDTRESLHMQGLQIYNDLLQLIS